MYSFLWFNIPSFIRNADFRVCMTGNFIRTFELVVVIGRWRKTTKESHLYRISCNSMDGLSSDIPKVSS